MMNAVCSMALVLAMDASSSMSADSWNMQRNGLADAFEDPRVQEVVLKQRGGVAVTVVQWASQAVVVQPWVRLQDVGDLRTLAGQLRQQARSPNIGDQTGIGVGLNLAVMMFGNNHDWNQMPCEASRRVIDIHGDGRSNHGIDPAIVRDFAQQQDITVNGLPIIDGDDAVESHYRDQVITADGFAEVAQGYSDFGRAIRRKLITEIAQVR